MKTKTADMKTYRREYMRQYREANRERIRKIGVASNRRRAAERAATRALPENRQRARERSNAYRARLGFDVRKDRRLRRQYGISLQEWNDRIELQGGRCPICLGNLAQLCANLDHDHETLLNRDILCRGCNQAVGMVYESPATAERLADYLRKHGKK